MTAADAGRIFLLLAFSFTAFQLIATIWGATRGLPELIRSARNAAVATAVAMVGAMLALLYALLSRDFSLRYVAETTSRAMPLDVVVTSLYGGQPGSLLIWGTVLAALSAVAIWRTTIRYPELAPYLIGVLAALQAFFLLVLVFASSPFEPLPSPVPDGRGLNPLLWDDGMRVHPPLLLAGYASFAIPFGFAMAALISGRLGRGWLAATRRWMILAWFIQGLGLLAGAWWAYHVLGWGGYWGWDPVENVALMPWLVATAYLHSVMVQERRGMLKLWTMALVIATFVLAIFGTFVVRSGVLSSVHSFAESAIGPLFFAFLGLVIIGSIGLFFYRMPVLRSEGEFDSLVSKEASFLLNNLLFAAITAATFWGTVFPVVSELVRGSKMAVGPPFYNQVNGPLLLVMLLLMGVGPLLAWRHTSLHGLWQRHRWPILTAVVTSLLLWVLGMRQGLAILAFASSGFVAATIFFEFWWGGRTRHANSGEAWPTALTTLVSRARRRYGGYLVHLAMVFIAMGAIGYYFYRDETAETMRPGETLAIGRYVLTYQQTLQRQEPGRQVVTSRLGVAMDGKDIGTVEPGRHFIQGWESQPTTMVAIRTTWPWLDDLYVLLVSSNDDGSATFRVIVNPLVSLTWVGGVIFVLGTAVAVWPEARRRTVPRFSPAQEVVYSEA